LLALQDSFPLFKKKVKKLFDSKNAKGDKKITLRDIEKSISEYHKLKLLGKTSSKHYIQFRKDHKWVDFYEGMMNYMKGLSDGLGQPYLELVQTTLLAHILYILSCQ
jgi:hypothetical protein